MKLTRSILACSIVLLSACSTNEYDRQNTNTDPSSITLAADMGSQALMTKLTSGYLSGRDNVSILLTEEENVPAAMLNGSAQIGIMDRRWNDDEVGKFKAKFGDKPVAAIVTAYAMAIYVNSENAIDNISIDDFVAIYGADGSCDIAKKNQWPEIEAGLEFDNNAIKAINFDQSKRLYSYLEENVLCHGKFSDQLVTVSEFDSMRQAIEDNKNAIGYGRLNAQSDDIKQLAIENDRGEVIELTKSYALSGRYPLSKVFYIYLNLADQGLSAADYLNQIQFVDYIVSAEGQEQVHDEGFVTLPQPIVDQTRVSLGLQPALVEGGYR